MPPTNKIAREATLQKVLGAVGGDVTSYPQSGSEVAVAADGADHPLVAANADRTMVYLELISGGPVRIGEPGVVAGSGWFRLSDSAPGGFYPAGVVGEGAVHAIVEAAGTAATVLVSEAQSTE